MSTLAAYLSLTNAQDSPGEQNQEKQVCKGTPASKKQYGQNDHRTILFTRDANTNSPLPRLKSTKSRQRTRAVAKLVPSEEDGAEEHYDEEAKVTEREIKDNDIREKDTEEGEERERRGGQGR